MSNRKTSTSFMVFMSGVICLIFTFLFFVFSRQHVPNTRNQEQSDSLQVSRVLIDSFKSKLNLAEDSISLLKIEIDRLKSFPIKQDTIHIDTKKVR